MISLTQSDIAFSMKLAGQNLATKEALEIASSELSSGLKNNLIEATAGDLGKLFSIDRTLLRLNSKTDAIQLAGGKAEVTQTALGSIHENLVDFGSQLLSAVERGDLQTSRLIASDARHALGAVVASINSRYGRHSVFAGAAVERQAIGSAEDILNDVSVIVASSADSASAISAIDEYFYNSGGGFEMKVYLGSVDGAPPLRDENGGTIHYAVTANQPGIRSALRALSMAVVASDPSSFAGASDHIELLREAGTSAISAASDIITLKETLGFAEGRIEGEKARTLAMKNVFDLERAAIISADPYETAVKFEALQMQLQTIYTITARLTGLSLTNYLR